ncbi:TIGR02147 family protein [Chitinivibrio alkaliphilus]|uniref:DUF4423 domain-containing protein n=1 Tax=Chitinivibrio alkaliphilus ACht1 TaxID=1313304 RepID=U7D8C6_9BACT|nr:TIGR02147 family protein [Chitinivibrio alkaliphilus]ERP30680.1 hypothetical protein CALK_2513 [Chitinivibrio alkaliphilus ACht1]
MRPILFNYLEYREYLRDFYTAQKKEKSIFSYRYMAQRLSIDAGYLVKVLQETKHISSDTIPPIIQLCRLTEKEAKYLEHLVAFNKARDEGAIQHHFEALLSLRRNEITTIDEKSCQFYEKWYHTAVRAVISLGGFRGDCASLARSISPPITTEEAQESVTLLEELSLIQKDPSGEYVLTETLISTGSAWKSMTIRNFQRQTLDLAKQSLERQEKECRDISTVSITVAEEELPFIKERIAEFRTLMLNITQETQNHNRVYQLNIQLFPLSETVAPGRECTHGNK